MSTCYLPGWSCCKMGSSASQEVAERAPAQDLVLRTLFFIQGMRWRLNWKSLREGHLQGPTFRTPLFPVSFPDLGERGRPISVTPTPTPPPHTTEEAEAQKGSVTLPRPFHR